METGVRVVVLEKGVELVRSPLLSPVAARHRRRSLRGLCHCAPPPSLILGCRGGTGPRGALSHKVTPFQPRVAFRARATLLSGGRRRRADVRAGTEGGVARASGYRPVPGWPLGWGTIGLAMSLDREFQVPHATPPAPPRAGRTLTEGGLQNLLQLDFPGGALIGCSAGVVNTVKIKARITQCRASFTFTRSLTGTPVAEVAFAARSFPPPRMRRSSTLRPLLVELRLLRFQYSRSNASPSAGSTESNDAEIIELHASTAAFPGSADLWAVRNVRPGSAARLGLSGACFTPVRGRVSWTLGRHGKKTTLPDTLATRPAAACAPIAYPAFEPPLSTDLMSSVTLAGTTHA
ncbi:hypothetical protein DFH09DRAFT_1364706 [Mycena vulgaris]|nr:hypothetical protein DFH09DRAFT_1364706 [Mycena vulgaris]